MESIPISPTISIREAGFIDGSGKRQQQKLEEAPPQPYDEWRNEK